jgi:hypothetical protein
MPSDLIVNITGNFTGVKMASGVNNKINALVRRLGGRATIDVNVKTKASTKALTDLASKSNAVFKSASAGARAFNKAVTDVGKTAGFKKLVQDSKDLDVMLSALTARQHKFREATATDIKSAGGLKAFKQIEAQIDIDIRKTRQLQAEVEKSINVQVKGGVGSAKFQQLGVGEKQVKVKTATTKAATAEAKTLSISNKKKAILQQIYTIQERIAHISKIPVKSRTLKQSHELLGLEKKIVAAEGHMLQAAKAVEQAKRKQVLANSSLSKSQKNLSMAMTEFNAGQEKANASTRKQIDYRDKIRRLMAEEVLRLTKIQQKSAEIAALNGQQFTAKSSQAIRQDVRQRVTGGAKVSSLNADSQATALKRLENAARKTAAAERQLAASMKMVRAQSLTAEMAIRKHGTGLQKFGLQARLAIKRYAAYLLPTTGLFAVIGAIRQSVTSFVELEAEQTKLQQILGGTESSVAGLVSQFQGLATATGISVSETTKTARTLAQAGFGREDTGGESGLVEATELIGKTQLAATFGNLEEVTDGAIAAMRQFNLTTFELGDALDTVNQISKDFAVESKDIFEGIKKGGAAFATLGGSVKEFTVLMALLRDKTRESASTLGTFFKTGGIRLFAEKANDAIRALDSSILATNTLPDRLNALSKSFKNLDGIQQIYFAKQLVGVRQAGRLVAVLAAIEEGSEKAADSLGRATGSLDRDVGSRLDDVSTSFRKMREEINAAVKGFLDNDTTRTLLSGFTSLVSGISQLMGGLAPVLAPLIGVGGLMGGTMLIKNIVKPSAKNIELKNNTVRLQALTAAVQQNTAAQTGGAGMVAGGRGGSAALTPFAAHRKAQTQMGFRSARAQGMNATQAMAHSRANLPMTARSSMAFGAAGMPGKAGRFAMSGMGLGMGGMLAGGLLQSNAGDITTGGGATMHAAGGAMSMAGTGALVGTLFGPLGTGIGAAVGGLAGLTMALFDVNKAERERVKVMKDEALAKLVSTGAIPIDPRTGKPVDLNSQTGELASSDMTEIGLFNMFEPLKRLAFTKNLDLLGEQKGGNFEEKFKEFSKLRTDPATGEVSDDNLQWLVRQKKAFEELTPVTRALKSEFARTEGTPLEIRQAMVKTARNFDITIGEVEAIVKGFGIAFEQDGGLLALAFIDMQQVISRQAAKLAAIDLPTNRMLSSATSALAEEINKVKAGFTSASSVMDTFAGKTQPEFTPLINETASFSEAINQAKERLGADFGANGVTWDRSVASTSPEVNDLSRRGFFRGEEEIARRAAGGGVGVAGVTTDAAGLRSRSSFGTPAAGDNVSGADFVADMLDRERRAGAIGRSVSAIQTGSAGTSLLEDFMQQLQDIGDIEEGLSASGELGKEKVRADLNKEVDVILSEVRTVADSIGVDVAKDFEFLATTIKEGMPISLLEDLFTAADPTKVAEDFLGVTQATAGVIGLTNTLLEQSNFNAAETLKSIQAIASIESQQRDIKLQSAREQLAFDQSKMNQLIEIGVLDSKVAKQRLLSQEAVRSSALNMSQILASATGEGNILGDSKFSKKFDKRGRKGDPLGQQRIASKALGEVNQKRIALSQGLIVANSISKQMKEGVTFGDALASDQTNIQQLNEALKVIGMSPGTFSADGGLNAAMTQMKVLGDQANNVFAGMSSGTTELFNVFQDRISNLKTQLQEDLSIVTAIGDKFLMLDGPEERTKELTKLEDTAINARKMMDIITQSGTTAGGGGALTEAEIMSNQGLQGLATTIGDSIGQEGIQQILELAKSNMGGFEFTGTTTTPQELAKLLSIMATSIPTSAAQLKQGGPGGVPTATDFKQVQDAISLSMQATTNLNTELQSIAQMNIDHLEAQKAVIGEQIKNFKAVSESIPDVMKLEMTDLNITIDLTGIADFTSNLQQAVLSNLNLGTMIDDKIQAALSGGGP